MPTFQEYLGEAKGGFIPVHDNEDAIWGFIDFLADHTGKRKECEELDRDLQDYGVDMKKNPHRAVEMAMRLGIDQEAAVDAWRALLFQY